jgi:hypothetical protein
VGAGDGDFGPPHDDDDDDDDDDDGDTSRFWQSLS